MTTLELTDQGAIIVEQILKSVKHAETKHPEFAWQDNHTRYLAFAEEAGEVGKVAAVCFRFLKG